MLTLAVSILLVGQTRLVGELTKLITVDQFGWRPNATKIAVIAFPVIGQNSGTGFTPGALFEIREAAGNEIMFQGSIVPWQSGATAAVSGDKVWFADFSAFQTPGKYYLLDPKNKKRSYSFKISEDVYKPVMRASIRTYFYQRANVAIEAKHGHQWTHPVAHVGSNQDQAARYTQNGQILGNAKDLRGGWYDAGDLTKYVPFLQATMFNLLLAYETNPKTFGDATDIPESGNGVPDFVDEMKVELDWMLKMQDTDGGVHNRNGGATYNNGAGGALGPSSDTQPRFYTAKTTWATATAAAVWAKAVPTFQKFASTFPGYASTLQSAATSAWSYLEANPTMLPANGTDGASNVVSAQASSDQNGDRRDRVWAAAELFRLTGESKYKNYVDTWATNFNATSENGLHPLKDYKMCDPLNHNSLSQGLFTYCMTSGAKPEVVAAFKESVLNMSEIIRNNTGGLDDPYLNYCYPGHYTWGSNSHKCAWGRVLLFANMLNVNPAQSQNYQKIMNGYVHSIHGRNAMGWCYLSNMKSLGAGNSVMSIYHHWFQNGSIYDGGAIGPAPGFLAGGPNQYFSVSWIAPPYGQPPMKAYKDWNGAWNSAQNANEASWEITEPAIYYNASYSLLLAQMMK